MRTPFEGSLPARPDGAGVSGAVLWGLFALGIASFFTTLSLPYVVEEGVYSIITMEMRHSGDWLEPTQYWAPYRRPPLFHWFVIPVAEVVGWQNIAEATRLVSIAATAATGLLIAWFARRRFGNADFAAFAALCFLTYDVLAKRGWLGYVDPLFTLFVFAAVACLWLAVAEERRSWLWPAAAAVSAAFLVKALTAYAFVGSAAIVFLGWREGRRVLLSPVGLASAAVALVVPLLWFFAVTEPADGGRMIGDIGRRLFGHPGRHLAHVVEFPIDLLQYFLPLSLIVIWALLRRRVPDLGGDRLALAMAVIVLLMILPYWFSPNTQKRYLMPAIPMGSLLLAYLVWKAGTGWVRMTVWIMGVLIAVRWVAGFWFLPWYEGEARGGDYRGTAEAIIERAGPHPIYTVATRPAGLSVSANIDILRWPERPIGRPPRDGWEDGVLLADSRRVARGQEIARFEMPRGTVYLFCRGAACAAAGRAR